MAQKSGSTRRMGFTWWQGVICGALLTFAPSQAFLIGALMAPAIATAVVDMDAERAMTRAVAMVCVAASLSPVWHLWIAGNQLSAAVALLSDPMVVGLAWGGGASAWALCQVVPAVIESVWKAREALRAHAIEAEMRKLREEWDLS